MPQFGKAYFKPKNSFLSFMYVLLLLGTRYLKDWIWLHLWKHVNLYVCQLVFLPTHAHFGQLVHADLAKEFWPWIFWKNRKITKNPQIRPKKVSGFWSLLVSPQTRASAFLNFLFFWYETMSNCSQNWCIDWNSAVLCFKLLFHI